MLATHASLITEPPRVLRRLLNLGARSRSEEKQVFPNYANDAVALCLDRMEVLTQVLDVAIDGAVADIALVAVQAVQCVGAPKHPARTAERRWIVPIFREPCPRQ